jgi:hypothetical protein
VALQGQERGRLGGGTVGLWDRLGWGDPGGSRVCTCHSWRVVVFLPLCIYLQLSTLNQMVIIPVHVPKNDKFIALSNCKWHLRDPSKKILSLHCSAPRHTLDYMCYLGCSYGYLIFSYKEDFLLVNVYSGTEVKPPSLRSDSCSQIFYGILTSPLRSPNSHLILCSRNSMFLWQVGTNKWSEQPFAGERIVQILCH